jgi:hypothetical protein
MKYKTLFFLIIQIIFISAYILTWQETKKNFDMDIYDIMINILNFVGYILLTTYYYFHGQHEFKIKIVLLTIVLLINIDLYYYYIKVNRSPN